MILHGYKKEEYRQLKPYYTIRFKKLFGCEQMSQKDFVKAVSEDNRNRFVSELILRNGYSQTSPSSKVMFRLKIGEGNQDWGAEKGVIYYVLEILGITELVPVTEKKYCK